MNISNALKLQLNYCFSLCWWWQYLQQKVSGYFIWQLSLFDLCRLFNNSYIWYWYTSQNMVVLLSMSLTLCLGFRTCHMKFNDLLTPIVMTSLPSHLDTYASGHLGCSGGKTYLDKTWFIVTCRTHRGAGWQCPCHSHSSTLVPLSSWDKVRGNICDCILICVWYYWVFEQMASFLLAYLVSTSKLLPPSLVPLIFYDLYVILVPGFPGIRLSFAIRSRVPNKSSTKKSISGGSEEKVKYCLG